MLAGILIEAANHAIATGDFDVKDFCFYAFQLALAAIAREFVVPLKEHTEATVQAFRDGQATK